jgi:hypothetical protein
VADKAVPYEYIPNLGDEEELLFKCKVPDCDLEVKVSALRTHAAMVHNTTLYVTNMTTVRDDKRFTVKQ